MRADRQSAKLVVFPLFKLTDMHRNLFRPLHGQQPQLCLCVLTPWAEHRHKHEELMMPYGVSEHNFYFGHLDSCPLRISKSRNVTITRFRLENYVPQILPRPPASPLFNLPSSSIMVCIGIVFTYLIIGCIFVFRFPGLCFAQASQLFDSTRAKL